MQNEATAENTNKVFDFIQRNRKGIFIFLGIFVAAFIGMVAFFLVRDNIQKNAILQVEELNEKYMNLRMLFADPHYESDIEELLTDLNTFAKGRSGYAAGRAWSIIGQIHSAKKDWQKAEEAFLKAADAAPRSNIAPTAFFNAAAAAEEQGKISEAIELFERSIAHSFAFPSAPRAQFNIGRLYEQQGNYTAATEEYREILLNWPNIEEWSNLAQSRIIFIEAM